MLQLVSDPSVRTSLFNLSQTLQIVPNTSASRRHFCSSQILQLVTVTSAQIRFFNLSQTLYLVQDTVARPRHRNSSRIFQSSDIFQLDYETIDSLGTWCFSSPICRLISSLTVHLVHGGDVAYQLEHLWLSNSPVENFLLHKFSYRVYLALQLACQVSLALQLAYKDSKAL